MGVWKIFAYMTILHEAIGLGFFQTGRSTIGKVRYSATV